MVLFIDTSSKDFFVILFDNDKIIDNLKVENIITHSKIIDEKVKEFLIKNNINIQNIDNFAVSVGPGSYTGIRVGYSFILGLCESLNKKILTVNLLESMIFYCKNNDLYNDKYCFSLINANNNNVYVNIDDKNFKLNINDFKDLLTKKYNDKNIVLISTDHNLKECFEDLKDCEFIYIEDISKISIKFINKKLDNKEFSDNYKYRVDYLDQ